jgi:DNA recombination protein RmuC
MGEHVGKLGQSLDNSVKSFNSFVGSLETLVLPQARRFKDLRVTDGSRAIEILEPIEKEVRDPAAGRDLLLFEADAIPELTAAE